MNILEGWNWKAMEIELRHITKLFYQLKCINYCSFVNIIWSTYMANEWKVPIYNEEVF